MNRKNVAWLYQQLPELVDRGVLDDTAATRLRQHYGPLEKFGALQALIIFGALGGLLIGLGVILLLAHNWDSMSRLTRTSFVLLPLLAALAIAGHVLAKKMASIAWREGSATFLVLMIGSSIAMISQIYHTGGSIASFLLAWMLLGLPVVYLLRVSLAAALYLIALMFWCGYAQSEPHQAAAFWLLLGLLLPRLAVVGRTQPEGQISNTLSGLLCLCLTVGVAIMSVQVSMPLFWIFSESALLTALALGGTWLLARRLPVAGRAMQLFGVLGIAVLALTLTFSDVWTYSLHHAHSLAGSSMQSMMLIAVTGALYAGCVALNAAAWRWGRRSGLLLEIFPLLTAAAYFFNFSFSSSAIPLVLFNVYMLVLGVLMITSGIGAGRLDQTNGGMVILTTLIIVRFFDINLDFVTRALGFILIGIGFLVVNAITVRRRRSAAPTRAPEATPGGVQ